MKKKVLALVVLAAMLVSILPMAAFAAADYTVSKVYVDTDTATADGEDTLEFDVNLIDAAGDAQEEIFDHDGRIQLQGEAEGPQAWALQG